MSISLETPGHMDLYTVGHSNRTADEFLTLLKTYRIGHVVDVRTAAGSRRNPQFTKDALARTLQEHGIDYTHMPALGGFRRPQPESINTAWRNASFRGYADYMQTPAFTAALTDLLTLAADQPTTVMCAEAVPWRCHRSLIADAALVRGVTVYNIMSPTTCTQHALTRFARVEDGRLSYPSESEK